jgi:aquaporin Z
MAYAIGHISGRHLNPAVTVGLATAGRHPKAEVVPYIVAQLVGGACGAAAL